MSDLTEEEVDSINKSRGICPFCSEGDLIGGPIGGNSQNFCCDRCDQEMNLYLTSVGPDFVVGGELLDRHDPSLYGKLPLSKRWGILMTEKFRLH